MHPSEHLIWSPPTWILFYSHLLRDPAFFVSLIELPRVQKNKQTMPHRGLANCPNHLHPNIRSNKEQLLGWYLPHTGNLNSEYHPSVAINPWKTTSWPYYIQITSALAYPPTTLTNSIKRCPLLLSAPDSTTSPEASITTPSSHYTSSTSHQKMPRVRPASTVHHVHCCMDTCAYTARTQNSVYRHVREKHKKEMDAIKEKDSNYRRRIEYKKCYTAECSIVRSRVQNPRNEQISTLSSGAIPHASASTLSDPLQFSENVEQSMDGSIIPINTSVSITSLPYTIHVF